MGEIYCLGLSAWDKRCLKQPVNHPKMDTSVPGHRVTAVKLLPRVTVRILSVKQVRQKL